MTAWAPYAQTRVPEKTAKTDETRTVTGVSSVLAGNPYVSEVESAKATPPIGCPSPPDGTTTSGGRIARPERRAWLEASA
jgi:hypothetical protein